MSSFPRVTVIALGTLVLFLSSATAPAADPAQRGEEFFETKIRPVLAEQCYRCHSEQAKKSRGGLLLDTAAGLRRGGDSGAAVVASKPDASLLLKALRHDGELKMPPEKRLPDGVIADFEAWVKMGAPAPREGKAGVKCETDAEKARTFWAFQRPAARPAPKVKDKDWGTNDIDAFVLAELDKLGLRPVKPADKRELIRRATFDLTGLPPTPEEIVAFEKDSSAEAFARVVDRLLASEHYGERWGRYWLDVARYADDKALAFPAPRPHAYRYRDWVVRALNEDVPYDRFVRLQLAGDLVKDGDRQSSLIALGFQGLGAEYHKGSVPAQVKADELDDRVDTLTRGLLGLTVACARCHDHKFDPISQKDYHSLAAAYNGASWSVLTVSPPEVVDRYKAWEKDNKEIEARFATWSEEQKAGLLATEMRATEKYLLAAWRVRALRKAGVAVKEADVARRERLVPLFLTRTVAWLEAVKSKAVPAAVAEWMKATEAAEEVTRPEHGGVAVPEGLQKASADLQKAITTALDEKERLARARGDSKKPDRPSPQNEAMLRSLTQGNSAPFLVPPADLPGLLPPAAREKHAAFQQELERHRRAAPTTPVLAHGVSGGGAPMRVALRGNVERPGELAPPGFLPVLEPKPSALRERFTRLDLAEAVCSPDNPLTARVIVNRVWMHHFGRGIVGTPSNFGALGEKPTHPELLDALAVRFARGGWSLKWLHRQIMLSSTYRLSSAHDAKNAAIDPANTYLWRHSPRRLDVEAWRDSILAVSGRLDRTLGGPPSGLGEPTHVRRTIYGTVSRLEPDKMLVAFDFPDANVSSERRAVTVVPQQQLFVLNSTFMIASAKALAARLQKAALGDEERVTLAHRWAFGRTPTPGEVRLALKFLAVPADPEDKLTAWEQYAQAILASNEFVWID